MSSSETERQGHVGDLREKSKEQLVELLSRQNKLLSNKRFIQTLPDKGRKISEFAERVRLTLAHHEEEEIKQDKLSFVRSELQSKYQQALSQRQPAIHNKPGASQQSSQDGDAALGRVQDMDASHLSPPEQECLINTISGVSAAVATESIPVGNAGTSQNSDWTKESDLAEALQRVSLSDSSTGSSGSSKDTSHRHPAPNNPFSGRQPQKKPHYIEVLERTEKNPESTKHRFKLNQLRAPRTDSPPTAGSLSPSRSPGVSSPSSPLSAEARRERDRKHLDDITSARLPPLHYSPALLLSLDESASLLREQTKKELELQAKVAAQKLSEGLRIGMGSFHPDPGGGPLAAYREVHDDGAQHSSEED